MDNLTSAVVYQLMKANFSKNNDYGDDDFSDSILQLNEFGISNVLAFETLISNTKDMVIEYDKNFIKDKAVVYRELQGDKFVDERLEKEFFFSYQGLITSMLKIEFPNEFAEFQRS